MELRPPNCEGWEQKDGAAGIHKTNHEQAMDRHGKKYAWRGKGTSLGMRAGEGERSSAVERIFSTHYRLTYAWREPAGRRGDEMQDKDKRCMQMHSKKYKSK